MTKAKRKTVWAMIDGEPRRCEVVRPNPGKFRPDLVQVCVPRGQARVMLMRDVDVDALYRSERELRWALCKEARKGVDRKLAAQRSATKHHEAQVRHSRKAYQLAQKAFVRASK